MRGFDYRAPGGGFGLLLMQGCNSRRAFRQAIGRAGRKDDAGSWAKLAAVGQGYPEDGDKEQANRLRLLAK